MNKRRVAYVSVVVIAIVLFLVLAPVAVPSQFGVDICPLNSLAYTPYVSMTYLLFRFGGVYQGGFGYHVYTSSFC